MQELTDSIKRPNLRVTGPDKWVEVQAKGYITYLIKQ
jgi:hypothetical protein